MDNSKHAPDSSPPLVSVLLPAYNSAKSIGSAIESILNQTYQHFEILVVDDGSTDTTTKIVSRIDDERITLLKEPHGGVARALAVAVKAARGTYCVRMDSDDSCAPMRLAALVAHLERYPQLVAVGSAARLMSIDGQVIGYRTVPMQRDYCYWTLSRRNPMIHGSVAFRRDAIAQIGGYGTIALVEDYDLWCRLALEHGPAIENLGDVLYDYTLNVEGVSATATTAQLNASRRIAHAYRRRLLGTHDWALRMLILQGLEHMAKGFSRSRDRNRFVVDALATAWSCATIGRPRQALRFAGAAAFFGLRLDNRNWLLLDSRSVRAR